MQGKLKWCATRFGILLAVLVLIAGAAGCVYNPPPSQNLEVRTWYALDAVTGNLTGSYILMDDLDSTTAGYEELASPRANAGKGWQPIGSWDARSTGSFDGRGCEIRNLFINRPDDNDVGLFGAVEQSGVIENIGVTNATVIGQDLVGTLAGFNAGTVNDSHSNSSVTGSSYHYRVGGLVGANEGTVANSYSTGTVTNGSNVGGLVGQNMGTISDCHSNGNASAISWCVGGLVGHNGGTVSNSYPTGKVTGYSNIGGLVGDTYYGAVSNSYSAGRVTGTENVGGLVGENQMNATVSDSFWDTETSGQASSDGGTGKTTAQMKSISTFTDAAWNITAVASPGTRNRSYIWNVVNGVTSPFLSWQR